MSHGKKHNIASVNKDDCVACGSCVPVCPRSAIEMVGGVYAKITEEHCIGCKKCIKHCPASAILLREIAE